MTNEEQLINKYRRLDGVIATPPVLAPPEVRKPQGVMDLLQTYVAWFEPSSMRALEQFNLEDKKYLTDIQIMDSTAFRSRYKDKLSRWFFHSGEYAAEQYDRDGIRYPGLIFDTHSGRGIGRFISPSDVFCAAFTPEGISMMTVFPVPQEPIHTNNVANLPEVKSLKRFFTKFFSKGGRILLLGSEEELNSKYLDTIETYLQYSHIPTHHLVVKATPGDGRPRISSAFFFPGKIINSLKNHLVLIGDAKKTKDRDWLWEQFTKF